MLTICGSGMDVYSLRMLFSGKNDIRINDFSIVIADQNFNNLANRTLVQKFNQKFFFGNFKQCQAKIHQAIKEKKTILYVVSGSPLFYSGSDVMIRSLEEKFSFFNRHKHVTIFTAQSSLDAMLLATKIDQKDVEIISLHGRNFEENFSFTKYNSQKKYIFALCDEDSLKKIVTATQWLSDKTIEFILGFSLGSPREKILFFSLLELQNEVKKNKFKKNMYPVSVIIKKNFVLPILPLAQESFFRDKNMITSFDKRQLALNELCLHNAKILWDMGAGSGSVGIEANLMYSVVPIFFEKNITRIAVLKKNLQKFSVLHAQVQQGDFVQNLISLSKQEKFPLPDRIFLGGGGEPAAEKVAQIFKLLVEGGMLIAFYVCLDHLSLAMQQLKKNKIIFNVKSVLLTHYKDALPRIADTERELFILRAVKTTKGIT